MKLAFRLLLLALVFGSVVARAEPRAHQPDVIFLDNGVIRVGADLKLGGAITWLSRSGDTLNLINSYDWGRQVQMSYYSGPVPFIPAGKEIAPQWRGLGWNPIQAGDHFGHGSPVLESSHDGQSIHVKCTPMQWPLNDVPGDCTFESWLELDGNTVRARCRLNNQRSDHRQYAARMQEMPAVYTNPPFSKIVSYTGDWPFTGAEAASVEAKQPPHWNRWLATEHWAALLNKDGWGLGVWNPDCTGFGGGFAGTPGEGDAKSASCGYLAPVRNEILDYNIVHEYRYELILGTQQEIRARVVKDSGAIQVPAWNFQKDRQGWYYHEAADAGWPIQGELAVHFEKGDPQLLSPLFCVQAEENPILIVDAAFATSEPNAQIFWSTLKQTGFSTEKSLFFPVQSDGQFHEYRVRLADSANYRGAIVQLRLDPANESAGAVRVRSIRFSRE